MALETVTYLPDTYCIKAREFSAGYSPNKIYVGRSRNLRRNVLVNLTFIFKSKEEMNQFFTWWKDETDSGGRPFYAKIPLYATDYKYYLVLQYGEFTQKVDPQYIISGKFMLYQNKTSDEKSPPVANDMARTLYEGSKNNIIQLDAFDPDGDVLQLTIVDSNGDPVESSQIYPYSTTTGTKAYIQAGSIIIETVRDYIGDDTIDYKAYDGIYFSDVATITITTQARGKEQFRVSDGSGSYEDYNVDDGAGTPEPFNSKTEE